MSQHDDGLGYSAFKIFIILFILTALEVGWGVWMRDFGRFVLWGGLLGFAFAKGVLIFMYFMHMKYEKMIVWSMIIPTPFLIAVVLFALMPDISFNDEQLDHPISQMAAGPNGEVVGLFMGNTHLDHGGQPDTWTGTEDPAGEHGSDGHGQDDDGHSHEDGDGHGHDGDEDH